MAAEVEVDRRQLLGTALRRRRLVMARAAKNSDWKTYLAAADSEAKLLGLNAPVQTEHHVLIGKVQDMSKGVVEVVQEFFADDPIQRGRFVEVLRARLASQLARRPDVPLVVDAANEPPAALEACSGTATQVVTSSDEAVASDASVSSVTAAAHVAP